MTLICERAVAVERVTSVRSSAWADINSAISERRLGGAHSGPSDIDCKLSRTVHPAQIRRAGIAQRGLPSST